MNKRIKTAVGSVALVSAGDFLERRGSDGDAEHAMIMLRWDAATNEATVFNGPWSVTLRRVKVHEDEVNSGKDFWIGRI